MEKGISKYWTPEQEEAWARRLEGSHTFAARHLLLTIRDLFKYDGRTKQAKRAIAQGKLRLATATDEELREIAELQERMQGGGGAAAVPGTLEDYKRERATIREKGLTKRSCDANRA